MLESLAARRLQTKAVNSLGSFQMINGRVVAYDDNQNNYIVKGYNVNDLVYSIVRLITDKAKCAQWNIYKIGDESAYKKLQGEIARKDHDIAKIAKLQSKALQPAPNPGKWGDLVKYPNEWESYNDQVAYGIAFKLLTGNKYKWANILQGGANAGVPYEIRLLPSQWMNIISSGGFPAVPVGYRYQILPGDAYLPESILHEKYFNPNYDVAGTELYGMAPLRSGLKRLQKSNSQLLAETSAWANEQVKGVLAMQNKIGEVDGEQAQTQVEALADTMRQEWRGETNHGRIGLSGYDLSWIPIGLNADETQLIESGLVDLRLLCNIFGGVPSQLLNDPATRTYNTAKESEKALTSRCVLPELYAEKESMNRKASRDWGLPKGLVIDFDMTVYSELAADVKDVADWTSKLVAIIPNEQREQCGLAAIDDPVMNEGWVMQGTNRIPLSDYNANQVDNALNDGQGDGQIN